MCDTHRPKYLALIDMAKAHGFNLKVNGTHVSTVGIDKEHYAIVGSTTFVQRKDGSRSYTLHFSGMAADEGDHLDWYNADLKLGDIITMEVVDGPFDMPRNRYKFEIDPEQKLKEKLANYYHLKEELKDHLKK